MIVLDLLKLLIESSIAITGFAGIVIAFRYKEDSKIQRRSVASLTSILKLSLLTAFFAFIPLILITFGLKDELLWTICSIIGAAVGFALMYSIDRKIRPAINKSDLWIKYVLIQGISLFLIVCLILNSTNIIFHREPGPYLLSGFFMLTLSGYMFFGLLLNPLWKQVLKNESNK